MSRAKLKKLGVDLPLLPTTSVGSFPKPDSLLEARKSVSQGKMQESDIAKLEQQATEEWIRFQEQADVDVLVDGEMYRGDMVAYFAERMQGFKVSGLVRSYGNRFYKKPIINGRVRCTAPITVDWWKRAQASTRRPIKGMLTGPYTVMDWSFNEFYEDRRAACMALALEIRKEVRALIDAGAKIIQIDEPALSVRPSELALAIDAMGVVTEGLDAYFITHVCYGDFEKIYPEMLRMPVDNFDLELANSGYDLLQLFAKHQFTKDITVGVVDVHTREMESLEAVKEGIRKTLKCIPAEQVWIDPDCGLKTRSVDEAKRKMRLVVDATAAVRGELRR